MILRGLQIRKVAFGDKHKRQRVVNFTPGSIYKDDNNLGAESQLTAFAQILNLMNESEPVIEIVEAPDFLQYEADVPRRTTHTLIRDEAFEDGETLKLGKCVFEIMKDIPPNPTNIAVKLVGETKDTLKVLADAINNKHHNCQFTAILHGELLLLQSVDIGFTGHVVAVESEGFTVSTACGANGDVRRTAKIKLLITEEIVAADVLTIDSGLPTLNDFIIQAKYDGTMVEPPWGHEIVDGFLILTDFDKVAAGTILSIHCYE